jgi:hypothetical protein
MSRCKAAEHWERVALLRADNGQRLGISSALLIFTDAQPRGIYSHLNVRCRSLPARLLPIGAGDHRLRTVF